MNVLRWMTTAIFSLIVYELLRHYHTLFREKHNVNGAKQASNEYSNCSLFYIDVGTNVGVQIRKLFEPSRYVNSPVLPIFDKYFGTNRSGLSNLCAVGFELNPSHTARLSELQRHYVTDCGYNVKIFTETAAHMHDGNIEFWSDNDAEHNEWGASTVKAAIHAGAGQKTVRAVNLAKLLMNEIIPRASTIVMKLDVEGAERNLLPHLIFTGALCHIDLVFMEVHHTFFSQQDAANVKSSMALFPDVSHAAGCKTVVSTLDDETYLHDADKTMNSC